MSRSHPKDAEFINKPITNYNQIQQIFSFGLATGKYAMGSSEPLGTPGLDDPDTWDSDMVVLDDDDQPASPGVGASAAAPRPGNAAYEASMKRRRSVFAEEDVVHMTFITDAVKEVAVAITNAAPPASTLPSTPPSWMPLLPLAQRPRWWLSATSTTTGDQGYGFVQTAEDHMDLWLKTFLGKHYYV